MQTSNNIILITGGATGIGLALAEHFTKAENKVIICGRRLEKLMEAKNKLPGIDTKVADISKQEEREQLINWLISHFPDFNILINNAGIQQMLNLKENPDFNLINNEIQTNFAAPVHLSTLAVSHLQKQSQAAIINITSGLAFIPLTVVPVYCATKSAMHAFNLSLRHQLKDTSIKVFEIIPPTVDTELDKGAREKRGQKDRGIPAQMIAEETLKAIQENRFESAIGMARNLLNASRSDKVEFVFQQMNQQSFPG